MSKSNEDLLLTNIRAAIQRVVGAKDVARETYLKADLGLDSIALLDVFFEIEIATGLGLRFSQWLLSPAGLNSATGDIQVKTILDHLQRLEGAPVTTPKT